MASEQRRSLRERLQSEAGESRPQKRTDLSRPWDWRDRSWASDPFSVMGRLAELTLTEWTTPALVLVRPRVSRVSMFAFNRTPALIAEGYRATLEAFDHIPDGLDSLPPGGIHPLRHVRVEIDSRRCVGCGLCVALNPRAFEFDTLGRAAVTRAHQTWTPVGDAAVRACPTGAAIRMKPEDYQRKVEALLTPGSES